VKLCSYLANELVQTLLKYNQIRLKFEKFIVIVFKLIFIRVCHCKERSDEAILFISINLEIASLRSQWHRYCYID